MAKKENMVKAVGLNVDKSPMMEKSGGRVLYNHALMYILNGSGFFEDMQTTRQRVVPGTVFYQYPKRWHHFDPDPGTVWTEYWVLFDGSRAQKDFGKLIPESKSIYNIGRIESVVEAYEELYDLWFYGSRGYVEYSSMLLHRILAEFYVRIKGIRFKRKDDIVCRAKMMMKEKLESEHVDFREFASRESISYEYFRKHFKKETGISPKHYFLVMKINRAKERLLRPGVSVKEISAELGFDDPYYFSRLFKKKQGISPKQFRLKILSYRTKGGRT